MADRYYTEDHIWVEIDNDLCKIGLTDFAQKELGEIVFIELPSLEQYIEYEGTICSIDSLKSSSDIYSPIAGKVVSVNKELGKGKNCRKINSDPYGEGWIVIIEAANKPDLSALLTEEGYAEYLK